MRRTNAAPAPPERVTLLYDDGREVPVEVVYAGVDGDGQHLWTAALSSYDARGLSHITAAILPARTVIGISLAS